MVRNEDYLKNESILALANNRIMVRFRSFQSILVYPQYLRILLSEKVFTNFLMEFDQRLTNDRFVNSSDYNQFVILLLSLSQGTAIIIHTDRVEFYILSTTPNRT